MSKTPPPGKSISKRGRVGEGAPSKFTPAVKERVLESLRRGHFLHVAASDAGISRELLWQWLDRGRREESGDFREFLNAVEDAEAKGEALHAQRIMDAGSEDWKASAHYLRYRKPERWSEKSTIEMKGEVKVSQEDTVIEALKKIAEKCAAKPEGDEG